MPSDLLRELAQSLRKTAAEHDRIRMVKCAEALLAARALSHLKERVLGHA
jgi:hypothetical protein